MIFLKFVNRFLALMLVLCMLMSFAPIQALAAQQSYTDEYGTWEYNINSDGTLTLIKYYGTAKHVVIPIVIDGRRVSALGNNMFHGNNTMFTVEIPYGIEAIGNSTFSQCSKLETVQIPSTVTSIGNNAFASCEQLGKIYIPSSVQTIGNNAFRDCPNVHVFCESGSAAEAYLKSNTEEIDAFTVIQRQPSPEENAPDAPTVSATPSVKKDLLTFQFGKKSNGKYEYTLVLEDRHIGFDLKALMLQHPTESQIRDVMENRFFLVSLTLADGTAYVPDEPITMTVLDIHNERYQDGTEDFVFQLFTNLFDSYHVPTLDILTFISRGNQDELVQYRVADHHRVTYNTPVDYQVSKDNTQVYSADGTMLQDMVVDTKTAQKDYLNASLQHAYISASKYSYSMTHDTESTREVHLGLTDRNRLDTWVLRHNSTTGAQNGFSSQKRLYDGDTLIERDNSGIWYGKNGEVCSSQFDAITKVGNGLYHFTRTNHHPEVDIYNYSYPATVYDPAANTFTDGRHTGTDTHTNTFSYRDLTLAAESVEATDARFYMQLDHEAHEQNLRDIASEHTDLRSDKFIFGNTHQDAYTDTDNNGNILQQNTVNTVWRDLRDHQYIGNTGTYVGWDWTQTTFLDNQVPTNYDYTVTEYRNDGSKWTKTVVNLRNQTSDYLENTITASEAQNQVSSWNFSVEVFEYDPSHDPPANDWMPMTPDTNGLSFTDSTGTQITPDVVSILTGTSEVIANGVTFQQQDEKDAMLSILHEISDADEVLERDYTQEAIDEYLSTPESKDLLDVLDIVPNQSNSTAAAVTFSVAEAPETSAPAVETPAEGAPAPDVSGESASIEDSPSENTVVTESSAESAPAENAPSENTDVIQSSDDSTPADNSPSEESAVADSSDDSAPAENSSGEDTAVAESFDDSASGEENTPAEESAE